MSAGNVPVDLDAYWAFWEERLGPGGLVSYRHIGCRSEADGRHAATGGLRLRRDLRWCGGLQAGPLGISLLDTAGINVDAIADAAPTQIGLVILDDAADVRALRIHGHVVREGRTQMFTEARFVDADDPGRVVALGTTSWAVARPKVPGYRYVDPGPGPDPDSELPTLAEAFDCRHRAGGGYEIKGLTERTCGGMTVGRCLHQGHIQVVLEAAAQEVAAPLSPVGAQPRLRHASITIVAKGTAGPFVSSATVVSVTAQSVATHSELHDEGTGRLIAAGIHVHVPVEPSTH